MPRTRAKLIKRGMSQMLSSQQMADAMMGLAAPVEAAAARDPNPEYAASIERRVHESSDRVSARVGAKPYLGMAVEAKRGTLARALGEAG